MILATQPRKRKNRMNSTVQVPTGTGSYDLPFYLSDFGEGIGCCMSILSFREETPAASI